MRFSLWDVADAAAKFINSLPKTSKYQSTLKFQKYLGEDEDDDDDY
jgi:hypothetical protein